VLPQLAKPALVRLIGDAHVEQTKRQIDQRTMLPVSDAGRAYQARRTRAQAIARSKRRGMFGLLKAISGKQG
jgi:hypothetical protein